MSEENFPAQFCADKLKSLSDPHRLRIIQLLRMGELAVSDMAELLESELVTVSHHLQILKSSGLVQTRREGRFIYYSLRPELLQCTDHVHPAFLNLGCCRIELPAVSDDEPPSDNPATAS